jgi:tRNA threonylcarbamoyladenosine biosynthesis protein TsaB
MKILAIDTSSKFLCLGIYDNAKVYEYNLEVDRHLSSLLADTIRRVLGALGWEARDMDYFACGLGPGSFTATRVGVATIKGLAWSLNKPVIGISSLDILAKNAQNTSGYIMPVVDAKRRLVYCSLYKMKDGILKRTSAYMLLNENELLKIIKDNSIILGDAVNLYKEKILKNKRGINILERDYWYPQAHNIIALAKDRIKDKKFNSSFQIKPIYLYPKECQVRS